LTVGEGERSVNGRGDVFLVEAPTARRHSEFDQLRARLALLERRVADLERPTAPRRGDPLRSLTEAERQIAELVALGLTNGQVACRLCFSAKTVEWRLTAIYRKLGVRSRTELAARCRSRETPGLSPVTGCDSPQQPRKEETR
jgi:DNA-binding CsgD family transcriptional regulator